MNKLGAMLHYEVLMAWRRRSLPILWLLLLVGVIGFALLVESTNRDTPIMDQAIGRTIDGSDAPDWAQGIDLVTATHTIALINVLIAGMIFYTVGVGLLLAEVIPLDRQFKVRELLDTLPISRATYLGGKLLGAWSGLLIGLVGVGAICALAIYLIIGVYDLRVFAALWIALLLPQSFVAAALSVLAASFVGSRRAAVLVGLVVMPFVLTLAAGSAVAFAGAGALIEPIYAIGILLVPGAETYAVIVGRITGALELIVGVTLAAWLIVWGWLRLREG